MSKVKLHTIQTGFFKLDGGAMFGVVPKTMWQKLNTPDENNLCTWSMRCLLVEDGDRKILIDTGMGNKQDDKFRSHFYPHGQETLLSSLAHKGFSPEDITDVLLTHLHFDHCGGALYYDDHGHIQPTFSNAKYWTNQYHYDWAVAPNEREKASFLRENIIPLKDLGLLHFMDMEEDILFSENISLHYVFGHTGGMMIPTITVPNRGKIIYCADLLPSVGHIGLPYVMAYDIQPLITITEKEVLFDRALDDNTFLFLEHDKEHECIALSRNEKGRVVYDRDIDLNQLA